MLDGIAQVRDARGRLMGANDADQAPQPIDELNDLGNQDPIRSTAFRESSHGSLDPAQQNVGFLLFGVGHGRISLQSWALVQFEASATYPFRARTR
jgi:hypothetical protein